MTTLWVDLLNPSHPLFFKPIVDELAKEFDIQITVRPRAETVLLAEQLGLEASVLGSFHDEKRMKTAATVNRVITLFTKVPSFDWSISLEDSDCVAVSRLKFKRSILFFDNDLKYRKRNGVIQFAENTVKLLATHIIVPKAAESMFADTNLRKKVHSFNGYKEDVYLADFKPNPSIKDQIPFDRYVVIRPEASLSFYVHDGSSLVPVLLSFFEGSGIPVVYLPRAKEDVDLAAGYEVFIPKVPLNGLDLCYYSDAVLTGSGTMAREAACMGKPAVSFFPGDELLGVDEQLIKDGKMIHSRDVMEIGEYVLSHQGKKNLTSYRRSQQVKKEVLGIVKDILQ